MESLSLTFKQLFLKRRVFIFAFCIFSFSIAAQTNRDTLFLVNQDRLIGNLKEVSQGKVNFKVGYSEKNLLLNWDEVSRVSSIDDFFFTFKSGIRIRGLIVGSNRESLKIQILDVILRPKRGNHDLDSGFIEIEKAQVVYIERAEDTFFKRLDGEVSLGANLAKANKLRQFSARSHLDYTGRWYGASLSFNGLRSLQAETEPIRRLDVGLTLVALLRNEWYVITRGSFLSNTEQLIDLRFDYKLGMGRYLIFQPKAKLSAQAGINLNFERFTAQPEENRSTELVYGVEIGFLDLGAFVIKGTVNGFSGLSTAGRFRSDSKLDIKYAFLDGFFLKLGTTFNYDNQATEGASNYDYIIQSTIGWSF